MHYCDTMSDIFSKMFLMDCEQTVFHLLVILDLFLSSITKSKQSEMREKRVAFTLSQNALLTSSRKQSTLRLSFKRHPFAVIKDYMYIRHLFGVIIILMPRKVQDSRRDLENICLHIGKTRGKSMFFFKQENSPLTSALEEVACGGNNEPYCLTGLINKNFLKKTFALVTCIHYPPHEQTDIFFSKLLLRMQ